MKAQILHYLTEAEPRMTAFPPDYMGTAFEILSEIDLHPLLLPKYVN